MTSRVKTVTRKVELRNVLKMQTAGQRDVIKLLKLSNSNFSSCFCLKVYSVHNNNPDDKRLVILLYQRR